jgi:NAD(P)-dependent dehydrogenase (short-subunit alcohol dehydrogenase family)
MPDILCTTGMLASLVLALRGRCGASSWSFLFAILAKETVVFFGLPILVACLLAKNCRSFREVVLRSMSWGAVPLIGLGVWLGLGLFGPATPWNLFQVISEKSAAPNSFRFFCSQGLICLFPCGLGALGLLGLAAAPWGRRLDIHFWLRRAILVSCALYTVGMYRTISEPQYFLPLLVWAIVAVCRGLPVLWEKWHASLAWKTAIAVSVVGHCLLAGLMVYQLKAPRIADYASVQAAARLIPSDARVVTLYRGYGASPAVWLHRNVYFVEDAATLERELPLLRSLHFTHLLILDTTSKQGNSNRPVPLSAQIKAALHLLPSARTTTTTDHAGPSSPARQFCDKNFERLFEAKHLVLYLMTAHPS